MYVDTHLMVRVNSGSFSPVGLLPAGEFKSGWCNVVWVAVNRRCLGPQTFGTWNITSLRRKEPDFGREAERCWLETVGLTSTHSLGSKTQSLTLYHPRGAHGERWQGGVGLLMSLLAKLLNVGIYTGGWESCVPSSTSRGLVSDCGFEQFGVLCFLGVPWKGNGKCPNGGLQLPLGQW